MIDSFLNVGNKPIPYYRQIGRRGLLIPRYLIGKGKIEDKRIYPDMGIDCSGFICRVMEINKPIREIISCRTRSFIPMFRFFLRPVENIDVALLIDPINAYRISEDQIQAGDLIHVGKKHAMVVFRITKSIIYYAHASEKHGSVQVHQIVRSDKSGISEWTWEDNYYCNLFKKTPGSGLVRLRRWLTK